MFVPLFEAPGPSERDALIFAVRDNRVAMHRIYPPPRALFLGVLEGQQCWAVDADADGDSVESPTYQDLRQLWDGVDEITWTVAGRGACGPPRRVQSRKRNGTPDCRIGE